MKKLLFLLLFPLIAFSQTAPKDGKYVNSSEMVYEIRITGDDIVFYLKEKESDKPDYSFSSQGKIVTANNRRIVEITGGKTLQREKDKLEIKFKDDTIEFKSYNLLNSFYNEFAIFSNKIQYKLQPN